MKKAFTLIELLVVIAIIAILAAILFPVFAQAKLAAKKTADLSNFKQATLGIQIYMGDSDDVYPLSYFWDGTSGYANGYAWSSSQCVIPYLKNTDIFKSPVDSMTVSHDAAYYGMAASRAPKAISFLSNGITPAYAMFGVPNPQGLMPMATSMPPTYNYTVATATTSATSPDNPVDIIVLANGYKEWYDVFSCGEWLNSEIDWCYRGNSVSEQWMVDYFVLATPTQNHYKIWRKFANGSNYSFADGHAKLLRPTEVRDAKRWIVNPPTS